MHSHLQRGLVFLFMALVVLFATGCHPGLHKKHFTGGEPKLFPVSPGANEHRAPWKELDGLIIQNLEYYDDIFVFNGTYARHIPFDRDNALVEGKVLGGYWKLIATRQKDGGLHVNTYVFENDGLPDKTVFDYQIDLVKFTQMTGLTAFANEVVDETMESCEQCVLKEGADEPPQVTSETASRGRYKYVDDVQYCWDKRCQCWVKVKSPEGMESIEP